MREDHKIPTQTLLKREGKKKKMERLTKRNKRGEIYFPYCFRSDTCQGFGDGTECGNCSFFMKLGSRLGAYEDTELDPWQVETLKERNKPKKARRYRNGKIICPTCGLIIRARERFCHQCGQRMKKEEK